MCRTTARAGIELDGPYFTRRTERLRALLAKVMTWLTRK